MWLSDSNIALGRIQASCPGGRQSKRFAASPQRPATVIIGGLQKTRRKACSTGRSRILARTKLIPGRRCCGLLCDSQKSGSESTHASLGLEDATSETCLGFVGCCCKLSTLALHGQSQPARGSTPSPTSLHFFSQRLGFAVRGVRWDERSIKQLDVSKPKSDHLRQAALRYTTLWFAYNRDSC